MRVRNGLCYSKRTEAGRNFSAYHCIELSPPTQALPLEFPGDGSNSNHGDGQQAQRATAIRHGTNTGEERAGSEGRMAKHPQKRTNKE
jgi:hypothetical protein